MNLVIQKNEFKFSRKKQLNLDSEALELPISEHIEEFRQRVFQYLSFAILIIGVFFFRITPIVELLEAPVQEIKFIQLSPGEYFLSTVKIAFYGGLLFSIPFLISQIIFYILPGLTKSEKKIILPILITSVVLFGLGLVFAYFVLIPAALNFFIGYSKTVIEPLWSFDQYFDFILFLFYSTGLSFQVPIIQIIVGLAGITTGKKMLNAWRYVILAATIVSAVLTPSTDPVTQLCLTLAIVFLYLVGSLVLIFYKK
uniref:Sec-independent protein translocase n=1 Tax=Aureoumbra lagunensis TaxID=44058 RepID=C6KJ27_9STRA|nr:sec-independent protein translocase [Aureoumbra lagunensis]ACS36983.1 sec-independent protein translocase [Aureoumbra lagunensis]